MLRTIWVAAVLGTMLQEERSVEERVTRRVPLRKWGSELGFGMHTLTGEVTMAKDFSPAAEAGIKLGDRIVVDSTDGEKWKSVVTDNYRSVLTIAEEPSMVGKWESERGRFRIRKTRTYVIRFTDRSIPNKVLVASPAPGKPCFLGTSSPPAGFSSYEGGWCSENMWMRWVSSRLELCFTTTEEPDTCYWRYFAYRLPEVVPVYTAMKDNTVTVPPRMLEQIIRTGHHMLLYINNQGSDCYACMLVNEIVSTWASGLKLTHPSVKIVKVEPSALGVTPSLRNLGIQKLPAFVFVRWGGIVLYKGSLDQSVVEWVKRMSTQTCTLLNTTADIQRTLADPVVLLSAPTADTSYRLLADTSPDVTCGVLNSDEAVQWYKSVSSTDVTLFKNYTYDKTRHSYTGTGYKNLVRFVKKNKHPLIVRCQEEYGLLSRVVLYWDGTRDAVWAAFTEYASRSLVFAVVNMQEEWGRAMATSHGVDYSLPSRVIAYDSHHAGGYLYHPTTSFTDFLAAYVNHTLTPQPLTTIPHGEHYMAGSSHTEAVKKPSIVAYIPNGQQTRSFTTILHSVNSELKQKNSSLRLKMMNTELDEGAPTGRGVLEKLYVSTKQYKPEAAGYYSLTGITINERPVWESVDRTGRVIYYNSQRRWIIGAWSDMEQEAAWVVSNATQGPDTYPQDVDVWAFWEPTASTWVVTPHVKIQDGTTRLCVYNNSSVVRTCPTPTLVRKPSLQGRCQAPFVSPASLKTTVDCLLASLGEDHGHVERESDAV